MTRGQITVGLNAGEMLHAATVGARRNIIRLTQQRAYSANGETPKEQWQRWIAGALAECATAKALGWYWNPSTGADDTDLPGIEVKAIDRPGLNLVVPGHQITKDTPSDLAYVLAIGTDHTWRLRGWMTAAEISQPHYYNTTLARPAFLVPNADLHPITELFDTAAARRDRYTPAGAA